jgi:hypothetical protein
VLFVGLVASGHLSVSSTLAVKGSTMEQTLFSRAAALSLVIACALLPQAAVVAMAQVGGNHDAAWWRTALLSAVRNGSDSDNPISEFRGPILVPIEQSVPFDQTVLSAVDRFGGSPYGNAQDEYEIRLGASSVETSIVLTGKRGRFEFDRMAQSCDIQAAYCTANVYGRADASSNEEFFSSITVKGQPAIVSHANCCAGGDWDISWYDPAADITYDINVFGDLDVWQHYDLDPSNVLYAEMLGARAEAMKPLELQGVVGATYNGIRANLFGIERPWQSGPSLRGGMEYLTVELRLDNLNDHPVDFTYVRFKVQLADNTRWETQPNWREPPLGDGQILPFSSVRGWVTFAVPAGVPAKELLWEAAANQTLSISLS